MKETYVLVHGAWLGAWCWDKIVPLLEAKGHKAIALDLPGHGSYKVNIEDQDIHTYSAYIAEILKQQEEPVILVAHSMGGMSVSEAAAMVPEKVKKCVYLAAFLPKDGQSNNKLGDDPDGIQPMDWLGMGRNPEVPVTLSASEKAMFLEDPFAMPVLYNDLPEEEAIEASKFHGWESIAAAYTKVHLNEAFDKLPKYYIKCERDAILQPEYQEQMMAATPVDKVYVIDSGHCPYLSKPVELTEVLLDIAEQ